MVVNCHTKKNKHAFLKGYLHAMGEPATRDSIELLHLDCELAQFGGWAGGGEPGGWDIQTKSLTRVLDMISFGQRFAKIVRTSTEIQNCIMDEGLSAVLMKMRSTFMTDIVRQGPWYYSARVDSDENSENPNIVDVFQQHSASTSTHTHTQRSTHIARGSSRIPVSLTSIYNKTLALLQVCVKRQEWQLAACHSTKGEREEGMKGDANLCDACLFMWQGGEFKNVGVGLYSLVISDSEGFFKLSHGSA